jgi:hypothetical protein
MTEVNVTNTFPHAVLTELPNERPTLHTLKLLHIEINANAVSVPSNRGNGTLGHLALVVTPATYNIASNNVAFIPPPNPGAAPVHPPQATQAIITETNRQFLADLNEFRTYNTTEAAIKKLLITAVPATFINHVRDEMLGFANISVLTILTHLDTTYGKLTTDDLDLNMANMHQDWNPSTPLETLFEQIRKCRAFAADTDPISESTAVRAIIQNLEKTGAFTDAIRDWRKRADVDKTLANLRTDFTHADRERQRHLTSQSAGYHNSAVALQNIALSATTPPTTNSRTLAIAQKPTYHYCWSHGYGPNQDHTSASCKFPAVGHRNDATVLNMLGGCNIIHRKRGEQGVFVKPIRANPTANTATPIAPPN